MPSDPKVWIVLIVVLGVAIFCAFWFRGKLRIRAGRNVIDVDPGTNPNKIRVAENAQLENVKAKDIVGRKSENVATPAAGEDIEVLRQAKISNSELNDIAGVIETKKSTPSTEKKK
jgi:hypothetical protein